MSGNILQQKASTVMAKVGSVGRNAATIALLASLLAATAANAQPIIFDNVPAGYEFGGGGSVIRGADTNPPLASISLAQPFTPAEDVTFGFVQLGLCRPQAGALIDVALYSGSGNGPETLIESLGTLDESQMLAEFPTDFRAGAIILSSALNPPLQAGVEYYIVATPATSTSEATWANAPHTSGMWTNIGDSGWQYGSGSYDWQVATRVFATAEAELVGPSNLPFGINNLAIVYSGGIALFDVRFDERSFDDVYGAGTPILPFTTEADTQAALDAIGDFFEADSITRLSSIPTYSGTFNDNLVFPITFDNTDVLTWSEVAFSGPAGWYYQGVWSPTLSRGMDLEGFDPDYVWATFTPVRSEASVSVKTITVTHPGNDGDDPHGGYGGIDYLYDIGQFEITAGQYTEFLNAVAADDTYGLYNPDMWNEDTGCKIERSGASGAYSYSIATDWRDLPVNFVSWGDAARFCNWLHNDQPIGKQNLTTTEDGSYYLNGATSDAELIAITRQPDATWVLPSEDEWYKAAYHYNDGTTANYWDYPTALNTAPTSEVPPGTDMTNGSANYYGTDYAVGTPYYRSDVGAYDSRPSTSPYGTFDQGGNVSEWTEGIAFTTSRVVRGGSFQSSSNDLRSSNQSSFNPTIELDGFGFRVARLRDNASPCLVPEQLSSLYVSGYAKNIAVENNIAYLARGAGGLLITDVSDPTSPAHLSGPDFSPNTFDVSAQGTTVYLTDLSAGFLIADASTPTSPTLLGSYNVGGPAYGLTLHGTTAYVAAFLNGLEILDVTNPATPVHLGNFNTNGSVIDVAVDNNIAYLACFDTGLWIVDVSDPANATLLAQYDTPGYAVAVDVYDGVAYISDGEAGLQIIDVSDPTAPWLLDTHDTPGTAINVVVQDDTAYVADSSAGVWLIDVTDPKSPELASSYSTPGSAGGVFLDKRTLYVADGDFGLHIVEIGRSSLPVTPLGSFDTPHFAANVTVIGTTAYVSDVASGLQITDVSDPANPLPLGSYDTPDSAVATVIAGNIAYVADRDTGLLILDVSNPASPALLGTYATPTEAFDVVVAGDLAYVACGIQGLQIVDVSTPESPTLVGSYDTLHEAVGVALVGSTVYMAVSSDGMVSLDVSNPAAPAFLGTYATTAQANDVAVVGNLAYLAVDTAGLHIVDVSDPASPAPLYVVDTPGVAWGVTAAGATAYVAASDGGLLIVDASDPSSPHQLASYDTTGFTEKVTVVGTTAYVANGPDGLLILDVTDPCDGYCMGDLNDNGQSNLLDHAIFADCMSGPEHSPSNGCGSADLDADGDIDLTDFAIFQTTFGCQ